MPSDYEAIRRDHERLYGEAVGEYGGILAELYADRTHFVFELLQNAQDAGATRIVFKLQPDRLEVRHDGRLFTESDVRSICAIKRSTKLDVDVEQIGRFGIGFKSVYAYSRSPAIHCGDEHFVITDYVHPHAVEPVEEYGWWTTLQVFPFDRDEVTAGEAVAQIGTRLAELSPRTILFLRNVRELTWSAGASEGGTILREEAEDGDARRIRLLHGQLAADAEEWLVFDQPVELVEGRPPNRVEIAFLCQVTDAGTRIVVADRTELVAFFPTSRETHLGFLIQGPFVATPARDNVREDNDVNKHLVKELAALTVKALPSIRDRGLLDVACLECLPIDIEAFPEGTLLRPLYEAVREALLEEPLIPTAEGGHAPGGGVRIARGLGLRELISPEQLAALIGAEGRVAWATADISVDRTPVLRRYLTGHQFLRDFRVVQAPGFAPVMELDPDAVVRRLEPDFLAEQSDEWMVELYSWLGGQRALFRELPRRRILRREDGEHVSALDDQDRPQVWLPPPSAQSSYPTIRRSIAEQPAVLDFLHQIGLTEPDVVDEVLTSIVPRYEVDEPDDTHYAADLERIALAVRTATGNKRTKLRAALEGTAFLVGRNAANGQEVWSLPSDLYEPTETLTTFLEGNPDAWFLVDDCVAYVDCWREVGLRGEVAIDRRKPDNRGYVVSASHHGWHRRGRDRFDSALEVEGLDWAVEHPNLERSLIIWSLVSELGVPLRGTVEQSTRQDYSNATVHQNVWSPAGQLLASHQWLVDRQGEWRKPGELSHDDLSEEFPEDEALARRLGMQPTVGREIAAYLEIEPEDLELLRRNPDILREALSAMRESSSDGVNGDDDGESGEQDVAVDLDLDEAIRDAFNKPGRVEVDEHLGDGRAADPERRRKRAADAIREAQAEEPKQQERWRMARRKEWEPRNPVVREYLLQTYGGRCQICQADPFPLRDGTPYFEAKYLISPTAARWVDDPGNALSLCPTCLAKVLYGSVEGPDVVEQLDDLASRASDLPDGGTINFELCGEPVQLTLRQRHLIDLAALVAAGRQTKD